MKKNLLIVLSLLIVFIVSTAGILTDSGRSGKAGSPSESTCVQCHSDNPINSQGGSVVISSNMSNWQYQPGQTYSMTVTISETGKTVFGLCFESLKNSDNTNAGTFAITHTTESQTMTASNGRACVTHKLDGGFVTTPGTKAFAFNWTAPATNVAILPFMLQLLQATTTAAKPVIMFTQPLMWLLPFQLAWTNMQQPCSSMYRPTL